MPDSLLTRIQTEYAYALQDQAALLEQVALSTNDVRDKAIDQAIREYSRRFPKIATALVASVSTGYYPLPSDWEPGLSRIVSIEFPIDQSPPLYAPPKSWRLVRRESGQVIYILPNPGGNFRLTYVTKHDETAPSASIPSDHAGALGKWAGKIAALEFMARYANSVQNNVDSVNYRTKEQEWRHVYDTLALQIDKELGSAEVAIQHEADPLTYFRGWDV
jgi:hypothetical protein